MPFEIWWKEKIGRFLSLLSSLEHIINAAIKYWRFSLVESAMHILLRFFNLIFPEAVYV